MEINKFFDKKYFEGIGTEFDYLKECIEILITNYQKDFRKVDEEYNEKIEELKKSGEYDEKIDKGLSATFGQMLEHSLSEPYTKLETFSEIIIETLLIKHIASIEKILISLSYKIQELEEEKIPPDFSINNKKFTDMNKAVEYISLATEKRLNISEVKSYEKIKLLRNLRHVFAHGGSSFLLKESVINKINNVCNIVEKRTIESIPGADEQLLWRYALTPERIPKNQNNEWICIINADILILRDLNNICSGFIKEVKRLCIERYIN